MSRFEFEQNPEGEPTLQMNMKVGEESVELSLEYETTCYFTHKSEYEHLDHIFVALDDTDEYSTMGAFIWRQMLPDWEDLKQALEDNDFQHIHKPYPDENDIEMYEKTGLTPLTGTLEPRVIEEVDDEEVAREAMKNWDAEYRWYAGEEGA